MAILNAAAGQVVGHRGDERFNMCSTFKLPLAAVILREIDAGRLRGTMIGHCTASDIAANSPITLANLDKGGMTLADPAAAAQQERDNTAASSRVRLLGGPTTVTAKLRMLGSKGRRPNGYEPAINLVMRDKSHNTTTPRGMATGMHANPLGQASKPPTRELPIEWMVDPKTAGPRLRAGFGAGWRAGDTTGSSWNEVVMIQKINNVAIFWPPGRVPTTVARYLDSSRSAGPIGSQDENILAEGGRICSEGLA